MAESTQHEGGVLVDYARSSYLKAELRDMETAPLTKNIGQRALRALVA
jgi:hypothetical protein